MIKVIKLSLVVIFFSITYSYAKDVYLSCESTTKFRTSFIINDEKKLLFSMVKKEKLLIGLKNSFHFGKVKQ